MKIRNKIIGFLNQRKIAGRMGTVANAQYVKVTAEELLNDFDLIRNMNDWRHLREVYCQQQKFQSILPSANGGHAEIREHMLEIIEVANQLANKPRVPIAVIKNPSNYHYKF